MKAGYRLVRDADVRGRSRTWMLAGVAIPCRECPEVGDEVEIAIEGPGAVSNRMVAADA